MLTVLFAVKGVGNADFVFRVIPDMLCPRLQKIQIFYKRGGNVLSSKASLSPRIRTIGIVAHIAMEGRAIDIAVMGEQPLNGFIHLAQFFSQHSAAGERRQYSLENIRLRSKLLLVMTKVSKGNSPVRKALMISSVER